jgi:hypothetical protein
MSRYEFKENFHAEFFPYYISLLFEKLGQINYKIS